MTQSTDFYAFVTDIETNYTISSKENMPSTET